MQLENNPVFNGGKTSTWTHEKKKKPKMYEVLGLGNSDLFLNKVKWANFEI